jgi:hypothetical protein
MGADRFSGPNPKQGCGAKRDAGASGERRNKPGGSIRPTEGRVFLRRGGVALLCRWCRIAMRSAPGHGTKPSRSNGSIWSESALTRCPLRAVKRVNIKDLWYETRRPVRMIAWLLTGGAVVRVAETREDQTPVSHAGFGVNPLAIRSHPGYLDGRRQLSL